VSRAAEGKELKAQNCSVSDTDTKVNAHTVPTLVDTGTTASNFSLRVRVNDVSASCLVDTGAAVSLMSTELWEKLEKNGTRPLLNRPDHELVGVQGAPLKLLGASKVEVTFHGLERKFLTDVQVAESITTEVILGRDFLQRNSCAVEMGASNQLRFTTEEYAVPFRWQEHW